MTSAHDRPSVLHAGASGPPPPSGLAAAWASTALAEKDPLSQVLRTVKLTGAMFFLIDAREPWNVEVPEAAAFAPVIMPQAQQVISYHIVLDGTGYASIPGMSPARFEGGDVIVFPQGDPYIMRNWPDAKPVQRPSEAMEFFREMAAGRLPFIVKEGGDGKEAHFACGFLGCDTKPFNPLLDALPPLLIVRRPSGNGSSVLDRLIELTLAEASAGRAGSDCIRLGLSELIFIEVVRQYLESLDTAQSGWFAALRDPAIGRALTLLHVQAAAPWTLDELAREAGMSRSVLAERFAQLVGCPPMQYLTQWRMQLAARLLADGAAKVASVGSEVGYDSEAAFSRTFKKHTGVSPSVWRQRRTY